MFINKIGYEHVLFGKNNQDYGLNLEKVKIICDGCSEGKHSEVGAKLFCHLFQRIYDGTLDITTQTIFNRIINELDFNQVENIKNYLLFTIIYLKQRENYYYIYNCGDGIIIKQKNDNTFEYDLIEQEGLPKYYAYNFIPEEYLSKYKNGVSFDEKEYLKSDYKAIGIASDGLQYILNSYFKDEFEELLIKRKEAAIKRLINREHKYFKDDITIVI
jgi:hypothetical protein